MVLLAVVAGRARGDVFNMPAGQTSLQFVTVGDAQNAPDTVVMAYDRTTGYGSVPYVYQMGKYDVTVAQYCQFLNAVAKIDTYGLYYSAMAPTPGDPAFTGSMPTIGITQAGSPGSYSYAVTGGYSQAANCPIFDVTWGNAARFCNWLENGQPAGAEGSATTETGAYALNGDTTQYLETRNRGASYFIPSENEWYKAAYYKGGSANAGYWAYPVTSNFGPSNVLSPTGTNNANCYYGAYTDAANYVTPVGAFAASPGPYGTFDMGGDVDQWNETVEFARYRGVRGGSWDDSGGDTGSNIDGNATPQYGSPTGGFRVASIPTGWFLDPGDANGDGRVDINDLTIVLTNFGQTSMTWSQGDFNTDGRVDIDDLTIVLSNFGMSSGGAVNSVPEPCALVLLLAAVACLFASPRLRRKGAR